jgi:cell division septation protein DedD
MLTSTTCRILFAACLSALCLIALSTHAATITVTNTNDSGPGSLRQTLAAANDGDTINFGVTGTITLVTGHLLVNKSVIISGPGANYLAVDANHASRVFYIAPGKAVIISRLTIANGSAPFAANGGGINNDHAILTLSECALSSNSALNGAGIFNDGSAGNATLTVLNSTFSGNSAGGSGGGIFNNGERSGSASLSVNNSTLSGNSTPGDGAGILNDGSGGSATLTITNSTLSGNLATGYGGGICSYGHFGSATSTITDSTVSGNSAGHNGGGIFNDGFGGNAALTVTSSTFSGNDYWGISIEAVQCCATLTISNTVLNAAAGRANIYNAYGTVTSLGYNLSSDNGGGFLIATGDRINTDPMLGPLQDNGGLTFTHELLFGSPAFDAGDPNLTPLPQYDQRGLGFPRVVNGRIDIGSFESHFTPTPTPTPTSTPTATATATATSTPTATATATATATSTPTATATATPTPTPTPTPAYAAQVQAPINPDGSSTFNVRRGVVPVKFNLTLGGIATCDLPPATIALTRTAGGVIGEINESDYSGNADTGSNFRIDSCQYVYNLDARALGVGTYRVDIMIGGQVVGNATFGLN